MKMSLKNLLIFFVLSALALTATCQVAHGEEVQSPFEFEYLVSLRMVYLFENDITRLPGSRTAGGVIIGDKWVLTVAHNFDSMDQCQPGRIKIVAGSKNINANERTEGAQIFNVNMAAVIMHQNWRDNHDDSYDVALIHLYRESFQMSPTVQLAELASKYWVILDYTWVTIAGWGSTQTEYDPVMAHRGDMQKIIWPEYCELTLNDPTDASDYFNEDHHLCYGCDEGTCSMGTLGDSGSPVVQFRDRFDEVGVVIGIHKGCCPADRTRICRPDSPGSMMDIRKIRDWIKLQQIGMLHF